MKITQEISVFPSVSGKIQGRGQIGEGIECTCEYQNPIHHPLGRSSKQKSSMGSTTH